MNSLFNLLGSSPLLKPHILSGVVSINGSLLGTPFLGQPAASSWHALAFPRSLEILFLPSENLFLKREKLHRPRSGEDGFYRNRGMLYLAKSAAQDMLNCQVLCYQGVATHWTHAILSFSDDQHYATVAARHSITPCLLLDYTHKE